MQLPGRMVTYNIMTDLSTGHVFAVGKDGRHYPLEDIEAAARRAERGDPEAQALLNLVDLSVDERGRPRSRAQISRDFARALDDCPMCVEARARGAPPAPAKPAAVISYLTRGERRAQARATRKAEYKAERAARRGRGLN